MSNKLSAASVKAGDWRAWFNVIPGGTPTLHVVGNIDVGNESDSLAISFDCLEKSMPPNLVLRIGYKTIFIPREKGDTHMLLHYTQTYAPGQVGHIVIVYPDGTHLTIENIGIAT